RQTLADAMAAASHGALAALLLPTNVQMMNVEVWGPAPKIIPASQPTGARRQSIDAAAALLSKSRRPVIVAGMGAHRAGAKAALVGDARLVAEQLLAALPGRPGSEKSFHTAENLARISGFDIAFDFEAAHTPRTVDPRALGVELDRLLPRERTIVYDAGNFLGILPYITVPTPGHLKMTSEFASIGLGFGTALGVAKGRPHVPTDLIIGDGGFPMTLR